MIKIKRISAPEQLTDVVKLQLTEEFIKDKKKAVWNKTYIRQRLLEMSNSKCCYCEELVGSGCNEMHIDHYHCKDTYPDEIFYMKNYRYCSKDCNPNSLGKISIGVLGLNDFDEKVMIRFKIGSELCKEFDKLYEDATDLGDDILKNTRKRNRILNGCLNNLKLCTRKSRFGASMATVLHEDEDYHSLRNLLIKYNLWDDELEHLHQESKNICLSKDIIVEDTN